MLRANGNYVYSTYSQILCIYSHSFHRQIVSFDAARVQVHNNSTKNLTTYVTVPEKRDLVAHNKKNRDFEASE